MHTCTLQSENISTPIYIECDKMYHSMVCIQEFWYFVSGLDIQLEQSKNNSPVCQKIGCRWRNTTSHILFFLPELIRTNGLVVKMSSRDSGDLGSIPVGF